MTYNQAIQTVENDINDGLYYTTFFGAYLLQDGAKIANYFKSTTANKVFNLRRIYFPLGKPLFQQREFKDYLIEIGLFTYWKNNQFPDFCHAVGDNDFQCDIDS